MNLAHIFPDGFITHPAAIKKTAIIFIIMLLAISWAYAQKSPVAWAPLREADVMYSKRVWRIIDSREKQNYPVRWPKSPLNKIIYNAVMDHTIGVYPNDDSLALDEQMDFEIASRIGYTTEIIQTLIDSTDIYSGTVDKEILVPFNAEKIVRYTIMEEWIFDKKTSEMIPRIIAIAPMYKPTVGSTGFELAEQPMYWLRYDELRQLLTQYKVYNNNTAAMLTYDDYFEQRMFHGYIVKENNPYDYYVKDFDEFKNDGVAALLESERIQNELFIAEHDLWEL